MIPITEEACPDISGKLLTQTFRVKLNKQITNRCLFIKYVQKKKMSSHTCNRKTDVVYCLLHSRFSPVTLEK